jgi:hypothetical protein
LNVTWSTELTALPAWGTPLNATVNGQAQLPMDVTQELIRLASLGHMQGLRNALDAALSRHPEYEIEGRELHTLLARFDLDGLTARLRAAAFAQPLEACL